VVDLIGINAYYTLLAMQLNVAQYVAPDYATKIPRFPGIEGLKTFKAGRLSVPSRAAVNYRFGQQPSFKRRQLPSYIPLQVPNKKPSGFAGFDALNGFYERSALRFAQALPRTISALVMREFPACTIYRQIFRGPISRQT
jgi:hypothetical protein